VNRTFRSMSVFSTLCVTATLAVATGPAQAAINCSPGTSTDIGYTVYADNRIKGSASFTSCPNNPVRKVEIWIRRNGGRPGGTKVTVDNIATPSSRYVRPKEIICRLPGSGSPDKYDTFVVFHHPNGKTELRSNSISTNCTSFGTAG
jgi:hypothetical protein